MVAAGIRTIFAQPDAAHVREQLDTVAGMLGRRFPKVGDHAARSRRRPHRIRRLPGSALGEDLVDQPLERLEKEILRRTDVVGVFSIPPRCCVWPARSWSRAAHDEWQVADKRYLSETSLALLDTSDQSAENRSPAAALMA